MGANRSTLNKSQKQDIDNYKATTVHQTKTNIQNARNAFIQSNTTAISTRDDALKLSYVAETQLDKGDAQFTKDDLIAIFKALEPNGDIETAKKMRVSDLRCRIRTLVYDPTRYWQSKPTLNLPPHCPWDSAFAAPVPPQKQLTNTTPRLSNCA